MSLFLHQVCRNVSLHQCLSNGCSAVNGCRQNESQWMLCSEWVPSEWESDKNTSPEDESCMFVRQNPSLRDFNFTLLLQAEMLLNLFETGEKSSSVYKTKQSNTALNKCVGWQEETDFTFHFKDVNWVDYCDVFIRLSFWRHPFTPEHPLTLILTAPIHSRASIDSHSDGTHSL